MAASDFAHIVTPRLRLAPLTEADPSEVAEAIGNYEVARWLGRVPYPYRPEDAAAFIAANAARVGKTWFIHDHGGVVGGLSIDHELGFWLSRAAWGRGYATEAGEAAIDAHFADPQAADLASGHYPGNDRSARVLRKLGFLPNGTKRVQAKALAQMVDSQQMLLTRADWQARREIRIETPRLVMRPFHEGDWRRVQQLGGTPDVARMMSSVDIAWDEAQVRAWIDRAPYRGRPGFRLALCLQSGALIGAVGLGPDLSLAYMIDRRYWGQGYATEALSAFIAEVFARFARIEALEADHFDDNPASARVLVKLGFQRSGTGLGRSRARLERAPIVLYRLTRDQFKANP